MRPTGPQPPALSATVSSAQLTAPPAWITRLPFFYGWVIVAVAFITMGIGVNTRTAFSVLFPAMLTEFGWERGVTAAAFSFGFLVYTLCSPFLGWTMDRVGPRWMMPGGVVVMSAGMALTTWVSQPWHLYLTQGVLVIGGSVVLSYTGHSLFLPHWFVRLRGFAIGTAFAGVGIGSIIIFPWLQRLIGSTGWRDACWTLAVVLLVTLVPLNGLFQRQRPADIGLLPDGDPMPTAAARRDAYVVDPQWAAQDWTLARALRTARFWWVFVAFFCALFAWYAVQVHQTKYLIDLGFASEQAAYALGYVGLTGIFGQIALGHLSDRIGREWVWTISCCGYVLCYGLLLLMAFAPTPLLLYLMVIAQGGMGYALAAIFGAIPAELFQGKQFGTIFGTLGLGSGAGAALGPWVTGVLYDRTGSYAPAFVMAIVLSLVSILAVWLAAPRKVRAVAGRVARTGASQGKA